MAMVPNDPRSFCFSPSDAPRERKGRQRVREKVVKDGSMEK